MEIKFTGKAVLTNEIVYFEELQIKHLKIIYKTLFGNNLDPEIIFYNLNKILINNTDIQKNILKLSYLDLMLLTLNIRAASISDIITLRFEDRANTTIDLNVSRLIDNIESITKQLVLEPLTTPTLKVYYTLPTINDILLITTSNNINDIYGNFISSIENENNCIDVKNLSQKEKTLLLEKIPAKVTSIVIKTVLNTINKLNNFNILQNITNLEDKTLLLNLNPFNLAVFIKFLFGEQLMSLYENIFGLCKLGNFTPEYLESCTPGEYLFFVKKLEAINKNNQTQDNTSISDYDPLKEYS